MILRGPGSAGAGVVGVGRVRWLLLSAAGALFLAFSIGFFGSYLEQLMVVSFEVTKIQSSVMCLPLATSGIHCTLMAVPPSHAPSAPPAPFSAVAQPSAGDLLVSASAGASFAPWRGTST